MCGRQRSAHAQSRRSRENDFLQMPIGQHFFALRKSAGITFDLRISLTAFRLGGLRNRDFDFVPNLVVSRNQPKRILFGKGEGSKNIPLGCGQLRIMCQAKRLSLRSYFYVINSFRQTIKHACAISFTGRACFIQCFHSTLCRSVFFHDSRSFCFASSQIASISASVISVNARPCFSVLDSR